MKDGSSVYVDMVESHAATHFADTPQLVGLVKEALPTVVPPEDYSRFEVNMGRVIGTSDLVETEPGDEIVYTKRVNRVTPESRPFLSTHALACGNQALVPGTETPDCPW